MSVYTIIDMDSPVRACVTLAVGASARRMNSLLMPGIGLKE